MSKEKTVKQACFLCTTSFQIWGAVAFQMSNRMKADILVFDDLNGYREIADGLRQTGLFDEVIAVDFYGSMKSRKKQPVIVRRMLSAGRYADKLVDKNTVYERLYTSSAAVSKTVVIRGLMKRTENTGIILYDDGLGSYSDTGRVRTGSVRFRTMKKLFGWDESLLHPEKIMLYEPELYQGAEISCVEAMPRIELNERNRELLRKIFRVPEADLHFPQKVMLFDTFRKSDSEDGRRMDVLFSLITEICGADNVILKEHPRSIKKSPAAVMRFPYSRVAVELVYAHQEDLEDKILVGLNSTALFTPKMIFGKEPRLIFLYRLISDDPEITAKRDAYLGNLATMYEHPDRVLFPATRQELEDALRLWVRPEEMTE